MENDKTEVFNGNKTQHIELLADNNPNCSWIKFTKTFNLILIFIL